MVMALLSCSPSQAKDALCPIAGTLPNAIKTNKGFKKLFIKTGFLEFRDFNKDISCVFIQIKISFMMIRYKYLKFFLTLSRKILI